MIELSISHSIECLESIKELYATEPELEQLFDYVIEHKLFSFVKPLDNSIPNIFEVQAELSHITHYWKSGELIFVALISCNETWAVKLSCNEYASADFYFGERIIQLARNKDFQQIVMLHNGYSADIFDYYDSSFFNLTICKTPTEWLTLVNDIITL